MKKKQEKAEGKAVEESDEESKKVGLTTFKKPRVKAKIPIKKGNTLKIDLKSKEDEMNNTSTQLKTVGPRLVTSKFNGDLGIAKKMDGEDFRKVQEGNSMKKPKIKSIPDGGVLTTALKQVAKGEGNLPVPRLDTPHERATRPNKRGFNTEDPLAPQPLSIHKIQKKIFPE